MLRRLAQYQQIRTRYHQGDWTPSLTEYAEELFHQQPSCRSLVLYLNVRHSTTGFNEAILKEVLTYAEEIDLSGAAQLRLAALCAEYALPIPPMLTETNPGRVLSRFPTLLSAVHFDSSRFGRNLRTTRLAKQLIRNTTDLSAHLVQDEQALKISIVGNAPTEIGKNDGQIIDNSDLVFRFNSAIISPQYSPAYGSRTDYWVVSPSYPFRKDEPKAENIVISGIAPFHKPSLYWQALAKLNNDSTNVRFFVFPSEIWYQLVSRLHAPPSAGLLCLATILPLQSQALSVELFGFSRYRETEKNHYGDSSRRSSRHNWSEESKLINELATNAEFARLNF